MKAGGRAASHGNRMNSSTRYVIKKESGSEWACVIDTETGRQVAKYSVLPRRHSGMPNGWERAERHKSALNRRADQTTATP